MELDAWLTKYRALREPDLKDSTLRLAEFAHARLIDGLGDVALASVTPAQADDWAQGLKGTLAPSTVAGYVRHAKAAFGRAKARGLIGANPFDGVSGSAPAPVKDWKLPGADDIARLVAAAPGPWKQLVGCCAYGGLRRGEAFRLDMRDVERARRRLYIVPEGRTETTKARVREVLLVPELAALLPAEGPVVADLRDNNVHEGMRRAFKAAGVTPWPAPLQTLRRWRENTWLAEGIPHPFVAAMMGHSIKVSERHYVKVPESVFATGSPQSLKV